MRDSSFIFQWVLTQLKRRSKSKHSLNGSWGGNVHFIAGDFRNVAAGREVSKTFRHARKGIVGVKKAARSGFDKGDSAGHVRQHFLVEDDFALQPLRPFHLALIEPVTQPCEDCRERDQPRSQDRHSSQKIMNRFVCEALRLLHYRHPTGLLDRTERIEVPVFLEMSDFVLADFID